MESQSSFQKSQDEKLWRSSLGNIQAAMVDACESGDVQRLQRLLDACDVKLGDAPVDPKYGEPDPGQSDPPPTWKLVAAAVERGNAAIVALLLKTYPKVNLYRQSVLEAALAKPHVETLKLLYSHCPSIIDYEFESLNSSLLMEACRSGHPLLPNFLLENGADPNGGGFPGAGPLFYAVKFEQPKEVVMKMISCGALVTSAVLYETIRKQDATILEILLKQGGPKDPQQALEYANETGNKRIISLIRAQAKKC